MNELKREHISALQDAIHEAAAWKGSFTDAEQRAEWDLFIATAQEGLNIIKKERKNERGFDHEHEQRNAGLQMP